LGAEDEVLGNVDVVDYAEAGAGEAVVAVQVIA
jgi:hypothetical protein